MKTQLTPDDIVRWFREQATLFNKMADQVESTFLRLPREAHPPRTEACEITVDGIKKMMEGRAIRLATLAEQLGVEKEVVKPLLTPENGFEIADQGWIRVSENGKK